MQRITITIDEELMAAIDAFIARDSYQSRSEAIRDLARAGIEQQRAPDDTSGACAAVVYVYDHATRELPKRLTRSMHHRHDLSLATFHTHLDPDTCMEVSLLRGPTAKVQHCAEHVIAERGVRHGRIVVVPLKSRQAMPKAPRRARGVRSAAANMTA